MKLNWGTGIALFYSLFMITLIYIVVQSTKYDRSLVVDNYYQKDLEYQSHLDKLTNASILKTDLKMYQNKKEEYLRFSFPKEIKDVNGELTFYRASDKNQDLTKEIQLDKNHDFVFPTTNLQKGFWKVKVNWTGDKIDFYKEIKIKI